MFRNLTFVRAAGLALMMAMIALQTTPAEAENGRVYLKVTKASFLVGGSSGTGTLRFRAILLTSLTTAAGLMPIMFEKSVQAQFVIPMAISLSFGILFATVITLFLVPSLYLLQVDGIARTRYLWDLLLGRPESTEYSETRATDSQG